MLMYGIDLEKITLQDIQNLIDEKVNESLYLEYKRELTLLKDKTEFLNDLTAMANSEGGDIIFGIEEDGGVPCKIPGMMIDNADKTQQQIENTIRDNVSPSMKYEIKFIRINVNQYVIIMRIPKSMNSPHMVYPGGHSFYKRNFSGKHRMEVDELRECFMTSAGYSKEAYLFHLKDELEYNKESLKNIESYLRGNVPIPSAFEAMSIGAGHIRLSAWDATVRAGILPMLSSDVQKAIQDADKNLRNAIRIIQMQNAQWKQLIEFDEYAKDKQIQRFPLKETHNQISRHLSEQIKSTLVYIDLALEKI